MRISIYTSMEKGFISPSDIVYLLHLGMTFLASPIMLNYAHVRVQGAHLRLWRTSLRLSGSVFCAWLKYKYKQQIKPTGQTRNKEAMMILIRPAEYVETVKTDTPVVQHGFHP